MRFGFCVSGQQHERLVLVYEKALAIIRSAMDSHTFADAWQRGGDLTVQKALALLEGRMPFGGSPPV